MTDHELLELAAKAAGIEIEPCTCSDPKWPFRLKPGSGYGHWNPLIHDADALRLAVMLRLTVKIEDHEIEVFDWKECLVSIGMFKGEDYCSATRRAIVRAAAELGKKK